MKKKYIAATLISAIAIILITAAFIPFSKTKNTMLNTPQKGFAVVELFTSEGCSSCPSADKAVAALLAKHTENVYILAFHVDYWNRLGWTDPFSKTEYSERQSKYASVFNLGSIYTPQVVVNGSAEFVGSDEGKLNNTVEKDLKQELTHPLKINAVRSGKIVKVSYEMDENEAVLLNIALVQPEATTSVKRGENGGRTLHHVNVVRSLKTLAVTGKGNVTIEIADELKLIPLELIAYTQEKKSFQIVGATQTPL